MTSNRDRPCQFCGHPFDHELLGAHGCANCHGEGLEASQPADPVAKKLADLDRKEQALGRYAEYLRSQAKKAVRAAKLGRNRCRLCRKKLRNCRC